MSQPDPISERHLAIDELDKTIVRLAARMNASHYKLLVLIREFDERAGWLKWGLSNCTQWLHWRCDLSLSAAREKVRVAHALKELPKISAAFAKGVLSYSKVRALTRVATVVNEASLLAFAMTTTAARLEERCRQMRNAEPESIVGANKAYARRSLRAWCDARRGMMTITVELPIENGVLVTRALDRAMESDGPEFEDTSWHAQQADALVAIARSYLAGGSKNSDGASAPVHQIVVHVDRSALAGGEGRSDLPVESVRRLSCDGSVVSTTDGDDGRPLSVGRKRRTVSAALRRALWSRDRGCSFPGCTHTRFVDAHHVRHWADGGGTDIDNLMLLCSKHHRLVHEGGYEICKDVRGRWYFKRPDGRAVPSTGYQPADLIDGGGASAEALTTGEPVPRWKPDRRRASAEALGAR